MKGKSGLTRLFLFKTDGKVDFYNEMGVYSGSCLGSNKFTIYNEGEKKKYLLIKDMREKFFMNTVNVKIFIQ